MAVVHIPEEEAVKDFRSVLSRIDEGIEVVIDRDEKPVRLLTDSVIRPLTFREAIHVLHHRSSESSGDETFADDIEFAMKRMRSVPNHPSPWE